MNETQLKTRDETPTDTLQTDAPSPTRLPRCFAHRGARAYAPENTLLAFALAYDLGADGIECDVQRSRDGRLVIIHDDLVDRTTDGTGAVASMSFRELSTLDAGVFPRIPQRIPTLQETLDLARERNGLINIEIKGGSVEASIEIARAVEPVLLALGDAFRRKVLVSSFDHPALTLLKERLPWLRIATLFDKDWRHQDVVTAARKLQAEAIHPAAVLVDPALIRRAHDAGLQVNVWTVNAPHDIRQLVAWGVDGIFTDYPERVLIARSLHHTRIGLPL